MKKKFSKDEKKGWLAILYCAFAVAVCFSVAVMALFVGSKNMFAWFGDNRAADAAGPSVGLRDSFGLIIRSTSNGEDVGETTTNNRLGFSVYPEGGVLRPGLTGAFDAYVVYGQGTRNPSYNLSISASCQPAPDGTSYRDNTVAIDQVRALELSQTHIAFFLGYENGVYSNWIAPGTAFTLPCTEASVAQEEQHITIYWMWVRTYEELQPDAVSTIAAPDRARMLAHVEQNPDQWFQNYNPLNDTEALRTNGYNDADTFLATILNAIWFQADFSAS